MSYDSVRFIQIFEQNSSRSKGTLFTNFDTVHEMNLSNKLVLHLSLTKM